MLIYIKGPRWTRVQENELTEIPTSPQLQENSTVIWEPEHQLVGVIALDGDSRHAATLIERRLRLDGSIDQDTKLILHHVKRSGTTYEALYSSVTLREWQQMHNWVKSQQVHCEWVPLIGLAWSYVTSDRSVVLHTSDTLHFLSNAAGRTILFSATLMEASYENLTYNLVSLAERARAEMDKDTGLNAGKVFNVLWITALVNLDSQLHNELQKVFCDSGNFSVHSSDITISAFDDLSNRATEPSQLSSSATDDGAVHLLINDNDADDREISSQHATAMRTESSVTTSLLNLAKKIPARLLLNNSREKLLILADRWIALYSIILVILICIAIYTTYAAYMESQGAAERLAALQLEIKEAEAGLQDAIVKEPQDLQAQLEFIERFRKVTSGFDVKEILMTLKDAAGAGLKILAVRSDGSGIESPDAQHAFFVDGLLSATSPTTDGTALSAFLKTLENNGYSVTPIESKSSGAPTDISVQLFTYRVVIPK